METKQTGLSSNEKRRTDLYHNPDLLPLTKLITSNLVSLVDKMQATTIRFLLHLQGKPMPNTMATRAKPPRTLKPALLIKRPIHLPLPLQVRLPTIRINRGMAVLKLP
jgi:hypothetical protein